VLKIGYTDASYCFDGRTCAVLTSIDRQSPAPWRRRLPPVSPPCLSPAAHAGRYDRRCPVPAETSDGGGAQGSEWPTAISLRPDGKSRVRGVRRRAPAGSPNRSGFTQHAERVGRRELKQSTIRQHSHRGSDPPVLESRAGVTWRQVPHQSHWSLRHRWSPWRRGAHRPQDIVTPMAEWRVMAAAPSAVRILQRWIAQATPRGGWRRTSLRRGSPSVVRCSWPTPWRGRAGLGAGGQLRYE
jgi:hypothetical protein